MFEDQPERRLSALKKNDAMGMTPLHTAALYDQSVIAEYLVQQVSAVCVYHYREV